MSNHFKAYIVVIVVSVAVWIIFRAPFAAAVGGRRYDNWRNLWIAYTTAAFVFTNYWVFLFAASAIIGVFALAEREKPAIYLLLCTAIPTLSTAIPGFGVVNFLFELSPQLAISFVILIPAMLAISRMRKPNTPINMTDRFFLAWIGLELLLALRSETFTHVLRNMFMAFVTVAPLYYVFSRWPRNLNDIRIMTAAIVLPIVVLAAISIPSFIRGWHFYLTVSTNWFGHIPFNYTSRAGYLRAAASVFNPVVWGFLTTTAIGLGIALFNEKFSRFFRYATFGLLIAGLVTSLSRGPWVGAVVIVATYAAVSPDRIKKLSQLAIVGAVGFLGALMTPFGSRLIELLPFVGGRASNTITYRQELIDAAIPVMMESPLLGSADFREHPGLQHMRQGQGIIDIVNTYLFVGLHSGLIGLALFIGVFASTLLALRRAMISAETYDPVLARYCRAYFATIVGMMFMIFTTSSEGQIPIFYWSIAALGVGLARVEYLARENTSVESATETIPEDNRFAWK